MRKLVLIAVGNPLRGGQCSITSAPLTARCGSSICIAGTTRVTPSQFPTGGSYGGGMFHGYGGIKISLSNHGTLDGVPFGVNVAFPPWHRKGCAVYSETKRGSHESRETSALTPSRVLRSWMTAA